MGKIIVELDAGHGGSDPGAVSRIVEKEHNLSLTMELGHYLSELGYYDVRYTRSNDATVSLTERSAKANRDGAKWFISNHANAGGGRGREIYAYKPGGNGEKLATAVNKYYGEYTALGNRGVKFANYAVLRETNMSAILVEDGFVDSDDAAIISSLDHRRGAVKAISRALCEMDGVAWRDLYAAPAPAPQPVTPPPAPAPVVPTPAPVVPAPQPVVTPVPGPQGPVGPQGPQGVPGPAGPAFQPYMGAITPEQQQSLGNMVWSVIAFILNLISGGK